MSTERDIIIERLEQKLAARDNEITKMQESLRESIILEMEKRFADKLKLRESTVDEIGKKFGEKINELLEMNRSLRDSLLEQRKSENGILQGCTTRMDRLERRLVELNSSYDGVMKELLDQKSIIQELRAKKVVREEPVTRQEIKQEVKPGVETKPAEKPKPKGEYIIADNYIPKEKRKQAPIIEAEEKTIVADEKEKVQLKKLPVKKSEKVMEGVEIVETLKKR
ncbi:MAG: hypothetical protein Q7U60_03285 [Candidatus Methanoperedens sp.]|nr:hypothetical protein [Candidatus Methanoperedens sp.]